MKKLIDYLVVGLIIGSVSLTSLVYVKHQERMQITEKWIPISQEKIKLEETK